MRTMASTAALRQACKRLLLHQRRVSRYPASGQQKPAMAKAPMNSGPFLSAHEMNATNISIAEPRGTSAAAEWACSS